MKMSLKFLKEWFEGEKRDFPWRKEHTPYRVWVSEVMLQQTRASVVVPYFERWMARFPTVEVLAKAPLDEVIKLWEGLGYYSRARSLHAGAQYLVEHHGGKLPDTAEELRQVKGIGPYTVGAILSFAFHKKAAAIDGNVSRVISRLFGIEEELETSLAKGKIRQKVEELLPDTEPWVIMEALIELGAQVCTRNPGCSLCPMREECVGYLTGKADLLPRKKKRAKVTYLERTVPLICHDGAYLVQRHEGKEVMAGLYEFPYFSKEEPWEAFFPGLLTLANRFPDVKHTFTRYQVTLYPTLWEASTKEEVAGFSWKTLAELLALPFSSGHRQILTHLKEAYANTTH